MQKTTLRQGFAQGRIYLTEHLGPAGRASDSHWPGREQGVGFNLPPIVGLLKENIVGLETFSFLKRNINSTPGCGFLGDGLGCCVCGIVTGVSLFFLMGVQYIEHFLL